MSFNFYYSFIALLTMVNVFSQEQDSIRLQGVFKERICSSSVTFNSFSSGFKPLKDAAIKENSFHLSLPGTIAPGVYQVQYNSDCGKQSIDVIINGIDREISFVKNLNNEFPSFTGSEENSRWSIYKKQTKSQVAKLGILYNFLSFYPVAEDNVVQQVAKVVARERKEYYNNFDNFIKNNKGSWAEKMVTNQPYYFSDIGAVPTRRDFIRRDYYWEDINTNDPMLINSPLYSNLIDNYLDYHSTNDYTPAEVDNYLDVSVAIIMEKFSHNPVTKAFALNYLKVKRSQMKKD
jgi:hypothetical protein